MKSKPVNVSWGPRTRKRAELLIELRDFKGVSDLLQTLIREEWERRQPPVLSSEAVEDAMKLLEMADEDTKPLHPTEKPKVSKPRKRPGT